MKLKTSDIPQADRLNLVRRLLEVIATSPNAPVKHLAEQTGFSERHVRYRMQAARVLGFLPAEGEHAVTARAKKLLATAPDSPEEKRQLVAAVKHCGSVNLIAPNLLDSDTVDVKKVSERIAQLSGLSAATAERRAVVLRSWHRALR